MPPTLFAAWAVEVGIITVSDLVDHHRPPLPSELLASFVIFGALAGLSGPAPKAAAVTGWGLVIATLLGKRVSALQSVAQFMSGDIGRAHLPSTGGTGGGPAGSTGVTGGTPSAPKQVIPATPKIPTRRPLTGPS